MGVVFECLCLLTASARQCDDTYDDDDDDNFNRPVARVS